MTPNVYPPPPPAPSEPKFSDSENRCGSENRMSPKFFWDKKSHRSTYKSKTCLFKKTYFEEMHGASH